ncbi:hypothetical protein [Paenibacillus xylanexedens]|uniref:hypothetical protein n=1 Tax=Paenibacillus xylanexedens TaxID=528191 RepID=UPI0011A25896|nr:hypothetical protein [Paenibacillus xylanexedens]
MKQIKTTQMPPYFKMLNCNTLNVLEKFLIGDNSIMFLDVYYEEDVDTFLTNSNLTKLDHVIQVINYSNRICFFPDIRSAKELSKEFMNQDWGFCCIVFDNNLKPLLYIRGIEEEGVHGVRIKELETGVYNKYLMNYQE